MRRDLDYYLSEIPSPYDENQEESLDLSYQGYRRYFFDLVKQNIGKSDNIVNIKLFPEAIAELDFKSLTMIRFLHDCMERLSTVYHLEVILDYVERTPLYQSNSEDIYRLLYFLETDDWIDELLPFSVITENNIYKTLLENIDKIRSSINLKNIPFLMSYFIQYSSKEDMCIMLRILIKKDKSRVLANQIVKGSSNDNDKEIGSSNAGQ